MKVPKSRHYAVVTGDVVGYTALSEGQRADLPSVLGHAFERIREHYTDRVSSKIDIFRGDSWQFVMSEPDQSLRAALLFRAVMISHSTDTRLAVGIGTVDFLPSATVPTGDGEAFRSSGGALDGMPRDERMVIRAPGPIGSLDPTTLDVLVALLDALVGGWTSRQAIAVSGALVGRNQQTTASNWGSGPISQQAVAQHLDRARWNAVSKALEYFESQFGAKDGM